MTTAAAVRDVESTVESFMTDLRRLREEITIRDFQAGSGDRQGFARG